MLAVMILAAAGALLAWLTLLSAWRAARRFVREHGGHVIAWRFITGAELAHRGGHPCPPGQECRAGRWAHARRRTRAAARHGSAAAILACGYGLIADAAALAAVLAAVAVLGAAGTVWRRRRRAVTRRHERAVIVPLAESLARILAVPGPDARRMVSLPAAALRRTRGELGAITLPDWYAASPDQRKAVDHLITSHIPAEVDTTWKTAGAPKRVIISAAPSPPDLVTWGSVADIMTGLPAGDVLLGLDRRGDPYVGSFNGGDDPHWGFSVGSGRGKSVCLCSIAAQILRQDPGASVLGVDPKMTSFDPLAGVPGVELANDPRDIPAMWAAIGRYRARMDERITAKKDDPTAEFPVALLFMDEINQFAAMSAAYWKEEGEKGTPPVWMDIAAVLWMGRFVHCHGVLVGQRLDDKATGGIGLRDSLGLRGLAGFRPNQWKMLVGTTPIPKSQKPRGRWIYTDGQDETWVQNVYGTPEELRAWAVDGRRAGAAASVLPFPASIAAGSPDGHGPVPGTVWVTGIKAGADYLGMSESAFEKARQRRPVTGEIRRGNQPAWSTENLDEWASSRPRASTAG